MTRPDAARIPDHWTPDQILRRYRGGHPPLGDRGAWCDGWHPTGVPPTVAQVTADARGHITVALLCDSCAGYTPPPGLLAERRLPRGLLETDAEALRRALADRHRQGTLW